MWNGCRTQEAIQGVFSKAQPLSVGTENEPCPYSSKAEDRDSYKGKQFGIAATKTGKLPKDLFDTQLKPLFEGDEFVDRMPYRELQPEKPERGFLTSDYSKRDEYSLTITQEQRRQQIKHEARVQKAAEQKLAARGSPEAAPAAGSSSPGSRPPKPNAPLLFDLVFASDADLCIKARRDTRNPTVLSTERKLGPYKTTAALTHTAPTKVSPPQYGIKRVVDS